jgi:hypothetical protein
MVVTSTRFYTKYIPSIASEGSTIILSVTIDWSPVPSVNLLGKPASSAPFPLVIS